MNKKTYIILGGCILFLIFSIFIGFQWVSRNNDEDDIEPTPTPTPAYQEVDENVEATLEANKARTMVTLTLSGLDGKYEGVEYELTYMTDNGPKGTLSGSRPINIKGEDTFEREVELGTCSTGGKCTYDVGVRDFKIFVKFHASNGEIFVLRKQIDEL